MRPQDLIEKKRDGKELTRDEIAFLIRGYTRDEIPDYQMAAWLMAGFLRGLTEAETVALVEEMLYSGDVLTHDHVPLPKVDKHSTGGVGDKTSLVLVPLAMASGVVVPMMCGVEHDYIINTLEKLAAIPGFKSHQTNEHFASQLARIGGAFDCFITVDKNLPAQNLVSALSFGVIVLRTSSNRLQSLRPLVPDILAALGEIQPDQLILIAAHTS